MKKLFSLMLFVTLFSISACGNGDDEHQEPLKVRFEDDTITIYIGGLYVLEPIVESGDFKIYDATWESSNPLVATVVGGTVTAKGIGETNISVSYNGVVCASCKVVVVPIEATSITLDKHNLDLIAGETEKLTYSIEPYQAAEKKVLWQSSAPYVVSVSTEGVVTAKKTGEATIKATVNGSSIFDECVVKVAPKQATGISLSQESALIFLGESLKLEAEVIPSDASNTSVIWSSANPEIATVDIYGNVHGKAIGTTQIIAQTDDGRFEDTCQIEVGGIDKFITTESSVGSEGSTSSGFYSYLRLQIQTNVDDAILITSIQLNDDKGNEKAFETLNILCKEYSNKYITVQQGTSLGNTYEAKGWKFIITYIWNDTEYQVIHVNTGISWPFSPAEL